MNVKDFLAAKRPFGVGDVVITDECVPLFITEVIENKHKYLNTKQYEVITLFNSVLRNSKVYKFLPDAVKITEIVPDDLMKAFLKLRDSDKFVCVLEPNQSLDKIGNDFDVGDFVLSKYKTIHKIVSIAPKTLKVDGKRLTKNEVFNISALAKVMPEVFL